MKYPWTYKPRAGHECSIMHGQFQGIIGFCLSNLGPTCNTDLVWKTPFVQAPPLPVFDLGQHVPTMNHIIYITKEGQTWFHDGMFIGCSLLYESQAITSIDTNGAVLAVYVSQSLS